MAQATPRRITVFKQATAEMFNLKLQRTSLQVVGRETITINSQFKSVMGPEIEILTEAEYLELHAIVQAPEILETDLDCIWPKLFPYLLQKIKLWGCNSIRPAKIKELITIRPTASPASKDDSKQTESRLSFVRKKDKATTALQTGGVNHSSSIPVSRADFVTFMLFSVDSLTSRSLLEVMSKFLLAMPLIVCHPETDERVLLITLLRDILIRWEATPGTIIENRLFRDPSRLILAVRIGSNANSAGKSSLLNQMMRKEHIFSSRDEPGAQFGKPCTLDGTVEFICLTEETVSDTFWSSYLSKHYATGNNELIILANLHENVSNYPDIITFFRSFNASFIVFLMPTATEDAVEQFLEIVPEGTTLHLITVDHEDHDDSNPSMVSTSNLASDVNLEKIRRSIHETIRTSHIQPDFSKISCKEFGRKMVMAPAVITEKSQAIVNFVKNKTCLGTRNMLQLQKCDLAAGKANMLKIWKENDDLQFLIRMFVDLQMLSPSEFKKAITHLEVELSILSNVESQSARERFVKYKESQRKLFQSVVKDKQLLEQQLQLDANNAMKEIDDINLGVEHFFRELIQIYQGNLFTNRTNVEKDIFSLPEYSADLLLHGFAIEILNGDSGIMPVQWLSATCKSICNKVPNLKVFVLSIIGLQSSGKSTLLNALFSCKFAVSVGRCSRGLFARLIFLDESMKKMFAFDALLLIDTEGLGSPEKMNDKDSEKKDRLMATFAMGVSDLTIINIMGESMTEMTEILQIAILAMARFESTGMKSDILVVQHLQERNASRLDASKESFIRALQYAFDLTKNSNSDMGTLDASSLTGLIQRVQEGSFLYQFSALKDGPTANASPSEAYHKDIVNLYKRIFEISREHPHKKEFSFWSKIVEAYWGFVSREKFALRFKSAVEMVEFINLEQRLAHMKELIAIAFRQHFRLLQGALKSKKKGRFSSRENCAAFIHESTAGLPFACRSIQLTQCDLCRKASSMIKEIQDMVKAGDSELNTNKIINNYVQKLRNYSAKLLLGIYDALEIQEESCEEFEQIVDNEIKNVLKQKPPGSFSPTEIQETTQIIWKILVDTIQAKSDTQPIYVRIENEIAESYKANSNFVEDYYRKDIPLKINSRGFVSKVTGILFVTQREIDKSPEQQLRNRLELTVYDFLENAKAERFESEMIDKLRKIFNIVITQFLHEFEGTFQTRAGVEFKLAAHAIGLKCFAESMRLLEDKWIEQNSAGGMLRKRESDLKLKIAVRLRHGFDSASEGALIGTQLFEAIRLKGACFVYEQLVERMLDQNWTTTSDKIRLLYFDELVQDIEHEINPPTMSLKHFSRPKRSIEKWYINKIDQFDSKEANTNYVSYAEQQFKHIVSFIITANSTEELLEWIEDYVNLTQGLTFKRTQTVSIILELFREHILNQLKEMKPLLQNVDPKIRKPSESVEVMNRIGCTASCPWCGALCWGARGHMENNVIQNSTRHYTCHQPSGLIGVNNRNTHELLAKSCEKYHDLSMVHFGEYKENGLLWKTAKEKHFCDWNFTEYPKPEFQKMMRWFFQELNGKIANERGLIPASKSQLERHECCRLNIAKIMPYVKSTIGPV